jgi:predicted NAD/FAD-binding protein
MYQKFRVGRFANVDIFFGTKKNTAGYNAYLSDLYGIGPRLHYSYAHNMEEFIPKTSVVDRWTHKVSRFSVAAVRTQHKIRASNGENSTYFAGAYLHQGWHEGAKESATDISNMP